MGACFQKKKNFERALVCYKKLMHESWKAGDIENEMQAYEFISKQYYYLGMLDKAALYHTKMTRGSCDPNDRPKGFETRPKFQKKD
jgi:hypothetical protein